jgi:septum formation protein
MESDIVLASASPRRARILRELGISFRRRSADVDESLLPGESPLAACERLARAKALAVAALEDAPVIGSDTLVVCDDVALGKPSSPEDAASMLRCLSGTTHEVATGVCVVADGVARSGLDRTRVTFAPLTQAEIDWYIATGEPLDKAGAYHVDGLAALFIESVSGSPTGVAGLPVHLLRRLLQEAGVDVGLP